MRAGKTTGNTTGGWKRPWRWLVLAALGCMGAAPAFADSFDLWRFATPAGTRSERADALLFTDATPTRFTTYGLYRPMRSSGDPARDFADEWQASVADHLKLTSELKSETVDWPGGWKFTLGAAKAWSPGARNFVALLGVYTGHGRKLSVVIQYNDDISRPQVDAFLASLSPATPGAGPAEATVATQSPAGAPALTAQEWYHSAANYSHWGSKFSGAQIAAINSQGYAKWAYRLHDDGSYDFSSEFWTMSRDAEYWFVEESGRWSTHGDTLELVPRKAARILRDRDGRQQGGAQALTPEPASYRYAFQYLSGMQRWYLVLIPTSGAETRRDGTRQNIPDYGPGYRYGPRPRCEQRPRPADCKG